jgi:hypothetical protein
VTLIERQARIKELLGLLKMHVGNLEAVAFNFLYSKPVIEAGEQLSSVESEKLLHSMTQNVQKELDLISTLVSEIDRQGCAPQAQTSGPVEESHL